MNKKAENKSILSWVVLAALVVFLFMKNTTLFSAIESQGATCIDTDGADKYSKGGVYFMNQNFLDECHIDGRVLEQECMDGAKIQTLYSCPPEFLCDDGACRGVEQ